MELTPFYLYDPQTFAYTEIVAAETKPQNSSQWPPPECGPNQCAYYNGFGWVKTLGPDHMTTDRIKTILSAIAAHKLTQKLSALNKGVSTQEVGTFTQQYAEAKAYISSGEVPVFLSALAQARSEDLDDLALKVVEKAEAYDQQKASALAAYQREVKGLEDQDLKLTQELLQYPTFLPT